MKGHIILLVSMATVIAGCTTSLNTTTYTGQYIGQMETGLIDYTTPLIMLDNRDQQPNFRNPNISDDQGSNIPTTGKISEKKFLSDTLPQIIFQDNKMIYSGIFSLTFPESFVEREYMTGSLEIISFSDIHKQHYFSIVTGNPSLSTERLNDKAKCTDNPIGMTTAAQKSLGNRTVYITTTIYPESKIPIQGFCFVDNGLIYTLTLTNYSHIYTDRIFDSFRFIETAKQQPEVGTNTTSEVQQSPITNLLSSIYSGIILSGHTLIYSGVFHIELPKYLQFRKSIYPGSYGVDIYFTDKLFRLFQLDDIRYVHLTRQPITLASNENDPNTCLIIQNDSSPNTSETIIGNDNTIIYKKNRSYDSFGYQRKQGDLCFVDDDFVYTISIRQYSVSDVISTINSLHFY